MDETNRDNKIIDEIVNCSQLHVQIEDKINNKNDKQIHGKTVNDNNENEKGKDKE